MTSRSTYRSALSVGGALMVTMLAGSASVTAQDAVAPAPPVGLTGLINISGSSTVQPITAAVQELFNADGGSPDVGITVDGPGTGDGFALFCNGETDISDASRAIKDSEAETCATNGVAYVELKVALDGLAVITSAANSAITCLSFNDLYALIGPEAGPRDANGDGNIDDSENGFQNWSEAQALATELGSSTVFPDAPLTITAPGEESGTYDFFIETVIAPIATTRGLPPEEAVARPDYQASADDNAIIAGVAGTPDNTTTLGWVGFAYVEENLDAVKPLAVDGGKGCVDNTVATIADASYPIARDLFIYVNTARATENPTLAAFVDYYLAPGTIESVLQTVPYVGLPAEAAQASRDAWAAR